MCVVALAVVMPAPAEAQIRGFADVGVVSFAASQSFDAIVGTRSITAVGGGGEVDLPAGFFAGVRASRIRKAGERVFLFGEQRFGLGIPTSITVTPLEFTGGYRVVRRGWRVIPYGGLGIGRYRYEETPKFATDEEKVNETFTSFHVLGGATVPILRWLGVGAEAQWATVPDALGQDPNGVSSEFDETDLGGATLRLKLVIGD